MTTRNTTDIPARELKDRPPEARLSDLKTRRSTLETERDTLELNAIGALDDVKAKNAQEIADRIDPALAELDKRIKDLEA